MPAAPRRENSPPVSSPFQASRFAGRSANGFRAPTLAQEHYASSSTIGVQLTPDETLVLYPVSALPVNSPAAIALGAKPLVPEKSHELLRGLRPAAGRLLDITLDAYQIKINDRILLTGTLVGSAVSSVLSAAGLESEPGRLVFYQWCGYRRRAAPISSATYRTDFGSGGPVELELLGQLSTKRNSIASKSRRRYSPPQVSS